LGSIDHGHTDTVFDAMGGVEEFEFGDDVASRTVGNAVDTDEWRIANEFGDIVCDAH
jgi:hypothetical protein